MPCFGASLSVTAGRTGFQRTTSSRRFRRTNEDADEMSPTTYRESYITRHLNRGFKINNANIDALATELRDDCNYSQFRIGATLSHFGGFE